MKIAAVDPSLTGTAVATSWGTLVVLRADKRRGAGRLDWIERRVVEEIAGAQLVTLEGYSYDSPNKAHDLGELGGVLRLALWRIGIPYVEVPPGKLKVFATGDGKSKKPAMMANAIRRLGYEGEDDNESDALWLLEMTRHAYKLPAVPLPRSHLRALTEGQGVVEWPKL